MQLFITDFEKKNNQIIIKNKSILDQIRKVLRMKIWDTIFVQHDNFRHEIKIKNRDKDTIFWDILDTKLFNEQICENWLAIAMSNKRDKMELIVQKLSEIWIKNIYFRPSERSIIRERNEKKLYRLNQIAKEAVEQSRWQYLPEIKFEKEIWKIISQYKDIIIFDKSENQYWKNQIKWNILWIIGPEWWLTENDYKKFWKKIKTISLWDTVFRTETASIIAWWLIKN